MQAELVLKSLGIQKSHSLFDKPERETDNLIEHFFGNQSAYFLKWYFFNAKCFSAFLPLLPGIFLA